MSSSSKLESVIASLLDLKKARAQEKHYKGEASRIQPEVLPMMSNLDPNNNGIIVDDTDTAAGTAFRQQNKGSEYWDVEGIVTYLKNKRSLWMQVSSRSFDPKKWEAEIANGNIPTKVANRFKQKNAPSAPFVRFGKAKKESL